MQLGDEFHKISTLLCNFYFFKFHLVIYVSQLLKVKYFRLLKRKKNLERINEKMLQRILAAFILIEKKYS